MRNRGDNKHNLRHGTGNWISITTVQTQQYTTTTIYMQICPIMGRNEQSNLVETVQTIERTDPIQSILYILYFMPSQQQATSAVRTVSIHCL